jgi:hypothetical protein
MQILLASLRKSTHNKALVRTQTTLRFVCAAQLGRYGAKMPKIFTFILLFYSRAAVCCPETEKLSWLETADPIADARSNFEVGKQQFRAVYSYTLMLSGLDPDTEWSNKQAKNFAIIEGTSDTSCDPDLNWKATDYAKRYNLEILALLSNEHHNQRMQYAPTAPDRRTAGR